MRGLFLRVYAGLVLVLLVSVAALALAPPPDPPDREEAIRRLVGLGPANIQESLSSAADPAVRAKELEGELGVQVKLLPEAAMTRAFEAKARRAMSSGTALMEIEDAGPAVYVPLPGKGTVAVVRPPWSQPTFDRTRALLLVSLALLAVTGLGVALIRPVERQLAAVTEAARRVGEGDLTARAPVDRADDAGALAEAFNAMAEQVETMVAGRERLMHGVSHELRTPLARLRFALELIDLASDEADRRKRIFEATADVDELEGLVRELLQYSKLQQAEATADTEPTDPAPLLADLVKDARRVRASTSLSFVDQGRGVVAPLDGKLFLRAVGNLVNNAARYADSEVVVTLHQEGRWMRVTVDDDGPGVPEAERERIFDPFARLDDARSRDTGGTGLGLPIAAGAARSHAGRIEVDDGPLGGARFSWVSPL